MTVNCSQVLSNGTYYELLCTDPLLCCTPGTVNTCSSSGCGQTTTTTDDGSELPVLFWGILGGLLGTGIILICVTYIVCRFRSPDSCLSRDPIEEIFEESESHEVRTVTSESRSSNPYLPTFLIRRESLWKLRTRRKSQSVRVTGIHPQLVCVECADKRLTSKAETQHTHRENGSTGTTFKTGVSNLPDVSA